MRLSQRPTIGQSAPVDAADDPSFGKVGDRDSANPSAEQGRAIENPTEEEPPIGRPRPKGRNGGVDT